MFLFRAIMIAFFILSSSNAFAWKSVYLIDCKASDYVKLNPDGTLITDIDSKKQNMNDGTFTADLETGMVRFTNGYKETYKIIQKGDENNDTVMILDEGHLSQRIPVDDFIRIRHWQDKDWNGVVFLKYGMDAMITGKCSVIR